MLTQHATRRAFMAAASAFAMTVSTRVFADGEEPVVIITGELTYLQRIALPDESVAIVEVMAAQNAPADASAAVEAHIPLEGRQVPVSFRIEVPHSRIEAGTTYVLRGSILVEKQIRWQSEAVEIDIAAGSLDLGTLILRPHTPPSPVDDENPDSRQPADIQGVEWRIVEIGGSPVADGAPVTTTLDTGGAFFGRACNSFSGTYEINGDSLSFGQTTSTMMACPEPMMSQERTLFDALERVTRYSLSEDGMLVLIDAQGNPVVVARR